MTIIDLLNKIANGEEVPKYVSYYNMLKDKIDTMMVCKENIISKLDNLEIQLNSRVGIIEKDNEIEKLRTWYSLEKDCENDNIQYANTNFENMFEKINEIIDYIKRGDTN